MVFIGRHLNCVANDDWVALDPSLITSEICMQCGKCCKTTWLQDRYTPHKNHPTSDKLPYLEAMFGRSPRSFVEPRGDDRVAVVNWCSQLMPDLSCKIYKNRPQMCRDYNCFEAANGLKRLPEYYDHIKGLIDDAKRRSEVEVEGKE